MTQAVLLSLARRIINVKQKETEMRFGMKNRNATAQGLMEVIAEMSESEGKFEDAARYYLQAAKDYANTNCQADYDRCFALYQECQTKAGYSFQGLTFHVR